MFCLFTITSCQCNGFLQSALKHIKFMQCYLSSWSVLLWLHFGSLWWTNEDLHMLSWPVVTFSCGSRLPGWGDFLCCLLSQGVTFKTCIIALCRFFSCSQNFICLLYILYRSMVIYISILWISVVLLSAV